jgi:hypothetical protein
MSLSSYLIKPTFRCIFSFMWMILLLLDLPPRLRSGFFNNYNENLLSKILASRAIFLALRCIILLMASLAFQGSALNMPKGLRQEDPLSPMLFILAMDPLHKLLDLATREGLLTPIGADPGKLRTSIYANDTILFIRQVAQDISNLQQLLTQYGNVTGLCTNIQQYQIFPIRCDNVNIQTTLGQFQV